MKKIRKEWLGFWLCLSLTAGLTTAMLFQSRSEFRNQVVESEVYLLQNEIQKITEVLEFEFLDQDLAFLDLGLPELIHKPNEFLEQIALQALAIPRIIQVFAFDSKGASIDLPTDTKKRKIGKERIYEVRNFEFSSRRLNDGTWSLVFGIKLEDYNCLLEVQMEDIPLVNEWQAIDQQLLKQGFFIIGAGSLLLFFIFQLLSKRIQEREDMLESKNRLLERTNLKLAQAYKTTSLGAITSHLMHSLKSPLTSLHAISRETGKDSPEDIRSVHRQIQDLVSESLNALQEVDQKKKSYELSILEIFEISQSRSKNSAKNGRVSIEKNSVLENSLDNLNSTLVIPILVCLIENAFQAKADCKVLLSARREKKSILLEVSDDAGGIPERLKDNLFLPSTSSKPHGTGLGLAIAKQLAESIEAQLELTSTTKDGSVFSLTITCDSI
tara:strand:+ start:1189 stop:2511 length:1323 start_codon:yes stop_codon:yes gene_type:complete